jgi:hypothetical protein
MGGVFLGTVVTAAIMLLLDYAASFTPALANLHAFGKILISSLVALVVLNARPVGFRTVWAERRDPFLLDEDVDAMIRGRISGIAFRVIVAILIRNVVLN